jgi:hypothetical protein
MPSSIALPSPADRHPSLFYENLPDFGDYIYSPSIASWTQRRAMNNGQPFLLCGSGRSPSVDQIALWYEIDSRLGELTGAAIEAVDQPPVKLRRSFFSLSPTFSRAELILREVRIEQDGSFALYLDTPIGDKIHMWPVVTFSDWRVTDSEWAC